MDEGGGSGAQVLHLQGNFEMRGADWQVTADSAEVQGPVQDPDQLTVIGRPARIRFMGDDGATVVGEGGRIVYSRRRGILELHGDATLRSGDLFLSGSQILYDLKAQRLRSGGAEGIRFTLSQKMP